MKKTVFYLQRISLCAVLALAALFFMPDYGYGEWTGWGTCACGCTIQGGEEACRRHMCEVHGQCYPAKESPGGVTTRPTPPSYDYGAERRAREAAERAARERKRREEEETRRRKFDANKKDLLQQMKGQPAGELRLKGAGQAVLKLKEPSFSKGHKGSAPPYLGNLDSKWPMVVDPAKVQGGTPQALKSANLRTHALLDALEAGAGNWEASIQYLKNRVIDSPNDLAVRDALHLVRGLYQGYLGAKNTADAHYKYGVRKWLEGDFDHASRSFARAFRENPDDMQLFRSFAHTLGLRDGSGRCKAPGTCSHINVPEKQLSEILGISKGTEQNLAEARTALTAAPGNLQLRATLNYLEGLAGYNDYLDIALDDKPKPLDKNALKLINQGLSRIGQNDYTGAWKNFAKAYEGNTDNRGILFVVHYAKGLAAVQRDETENVPAALWDQRTTEAYEEYQEKMLEEVQMEELLDLFYVDRPGQSSTVNLTRQTKSTETENPFFGLLSDEEIQRLMDGDGSLFR